jgi:hypothetical protein
MAVAIRRNEVALRQQEPEADVMDQWVRLGMAITIIALISVSLRQFGGSARAVEPSIPSIAYPR